MVSRKSSRKRSKRNSSSKRSNRKVSSLGQEILNQYKNNEKYKYTFLGTYYGNTAITKAKNLFFPDEEQEDDANKWIKNWSTKERSQSVLFVVIRKVRKNTYVYFKFVIGDSVLGEVYKDYDEGLDVFDSI